MRKRLRYTVFYARAQGGGVSAYFPAFPEITVWYPTLAQCRIAAQEALELDLEGPQSLGERPPREKRVLRAALNVEVG